MRLRALLSISVVATCVLGSVLAAGAALSGPLAQVIEGAKKEGAVSAKLVPTFTEKSMSLLEKEIKQKFGVDLKIKFIGSSYYPNDVSEAIMEEKAGATPSYDLLTLSAQIAGANKAGVLEKVDWKPLVLEGTNPEVIFDDPMMKGGIVYNTTFLGLLYNPEKIKADQVPRTMQDLANPIWKGKGGVWNGQNTWLRWAFMLGKDKMLNTLRAIMKNGAIQGGYSDLLNRYVLGEVSWCTIASQFMKLAKDKGMPAAWQSLDFADVTGHSLVVRKGARHPNAAKLVAVYLASPEGAKFTLEEGKSGNLYYPGNFEHEIRMQNQRQGIPEVIGERRPEILEFYDSKEASQLGKEFMMILQSGGAK